MASVTGPRKDVLLLAFNSSPKDLPRELKAKQLVNNNRYRFVTVSEAPLKEDATTELHHFDVNFKPDRGFKGIFDPKWQRPPAAALFLDYHWIESSYMAKRYGANWLWKVAYAFEQKDSDELIIILPYDSIGAPDGKSCMRDCLENGDSMGTSVSDLRALGLDYRLMGWDEASHYHPIVRADVQLMREKSDWVRVMIGQERYVDSKTPFVLFYRRYAAEDVRKGSIERVEHTWVERVNAFYGAPLVTRRMMQTWEHEGAVSAHPWAGLRIPQVASCSSSSSSSSTPSAGTSSSTTASSIAPCHGMHSRSAGKRGRVSEEAAVEDVAAVVVLGVANRRQY